MTKESIVSFAEQTVERLCFQYKEYTAVNKQIEMLKTSILKQASELTKDKKISLRDAIKQAEANQRPHMDVLEMDLAQISDEMTFANPLIWMMYKDKAYKGTTSEIATWKDFKKHCEPAGYICSVRYQFLHKHFQNNGQELDTLFADETPLDEVYLANDLLKLCLNTAFLKEWKLQEYKKTDDKTNKWGLITG